MNIVIFGTGLFYEKNKQNKDIVEKNIIAFLDNNEKKIGKQVDGLPILHPKEICNLEYDEVIIMSSYAYEIKNQLLELGVRLEQIISYPYGGMAYDTWFRAQKPNKEQLKLQIQKKFEYEPLISVVVPTYNTPTHFLIEMIESVRNQTYRNWELCVADGSTIKEVIELLQSYESTEQRIKVKYLKENQGISENTNKALLLATGEYIALLDHDDLLTEDALYEIVEAININNKPDFLYTDEDNIDETGKFLFGPIFKPDYSPDLLKSYAYILHLMVFSKTLLATVGKFRKEFDGSQDYDMSIRLTQKANQIIHIPKILYHWRYHINSVSANPNAKTYAIEASVKMLNRNLSESKIKGQVKEVVGMAAYRIQYEISKTPLISFINFQEELTQEKLDEIYHIVESSTYKNIEILIGTFKNQVEEGYTQHPINIIENNKEINIPTILNRISKSAKGEYIIFSCGEIESVSDDWIEEMLMHIQREEIGIVAPKIYNENKVYCVGVIVAKQVNNLYTLIAEEQLYFGRNSVTRNLSAVDKACFMISKELFAENGQFDEEYEAYYWNIALCLKIRKQERLVLFTPYSEVKFKNLQTEWPINNKDKKIFRNHLKRIAFKNDPYYNINLDYNSIGMLK